MKVNDKVCVNSLKMLAIEHYFITEENYTPIVVKGVKDEIWLENMDGPYKVVRINSNHIHKIYKIASECKTKRKTNLFYRCSHLQ